MIWLLIILGTWLVGAFITNILDGWFNWSNDNIEDERFLAIIWPLCVLVSPLILATYIRGKVVKVRKAKEEKEALQVKLRVDSERELKNIEEELGRELEQQKRYGSYR